MEPILSVNASVNAEVGCEWYQYKKSHNTVVNTDTDKWRQVAWRLMRVTSKNSPLVFTAIRPELMKASL